MRKYLSINSLVQGSNPSLTVFSQVSTTEAVRVSEGWGKPLNVSESVSKDERQGLFAKSPGRFAETLAPVIHGFQIVSLQ